MSSTSDLPSLLERREHAPLLAALAALLDQEGVDLVAAWESDARGHAAHANDLGDLGLLLLALLLLGVPLVEVVLGGLLVEVRDAQRVAHLLAGRVPLPVVERVLLGAPRSE